MRQNVKIIIPKCDKYGCSEENPVFFFTIQNKSFLLLPIHILKALEHMKNEKPDVVYFAKPHLFTFLPALLYKLFHPSCKLVFDCDEWDAATLKDNDEPFYKILLTEALAFLSISFPNVIIYSNTKIMKEKIPKKYWNKCFYLPNGVNTKQFKPTRRKRKEFSLVFVGLLHKIKHILSIVDAVETAKRRISNLKCYIVGDGPKKGELERIVSSKKLRDVFVFTGTVPHEKLPKLLASADVLLAPFSNLEGVRYQSNMKIFEYMASGVPIVATDVGDIKMILKNGNAGFVVPPDNSEAIAEKIIYIYKNPEKSKKVASLARKLAYEKYDWKVLAEKLSNFLS
ncbi:MAG: glycosyltransferase family 4 protein [Candidatus Micrarchaeia archaeon]